MVSAEKNLPAAAELGDAPEADRLQPDPMKKTRWVVKLGSQTYGNPTVAGGRVFVGTNNDSPRDPRRDGDRGVLMCFDETTGKFLWQLAVPKHPAGRNIDWEFVGLCSSPTVDGDRVYVVTNRCEVLCLDVGGLANGNEGPFKEEAAYLATPGKPPVDLGATDADVVWRFDMLDGLGVYPRYQTSSSILVVGDRLYVTTSNSVDWTGHHTPAPDAPALVCLDKRTGKVLAEEKSGISRRTFTSNWSSPAYGKFNGRELVVFGGGDGWCYGFDLDLKEVWRYDCNPGEYRAAGGKPIKYEDPKGPSEVIATPVVVDGRVYVCIGQDPEKGDGVGALNCIDGAMSGDITELGRVWRFTGIQRSMSTASVAGELIYVGDFAGFVYCLERSSGTLLWKHDTEGRAWGSTLVADGKVYFGNENGVLTVLAAGRDLKKLGEIDFGSTLYSTPVAANGALYVATDKHLYAIENKPSK
jgi:outer membrane protein assembly factor BamB